jgi:hypothetical protein
MGGKDREKKTSSHSETREKGIPTTPTTATQHDEKEKRRKNETKGLTLGGRGLGWRSHLP